MLLGSIVIALSGGILAALLLINQVNAQVGVSIGVGDTYVDIIGQTSPGAFVTIKDGEQVIGTTTADGAGAFTKRLGAQVYGIHALSVFAKTPGNTVSDSALVNANFREHETTEVFVFLPTTISLSGNDVPPGTELLMSGETIPGGVVSVYIDQDAPLVTMADPSGVWSLLVVPGQLAAGNHSVSVHVTASDGQQSSPTIPRFFTILAVSQSPPAAPAAPTRPTVTLPRDGATSTTETITVAGISEAYRQIEIWRNNRLMGSVYADDHGGWSMPLRLQPGLNEISSRACNAGVCSQFSSVIRVYYNPAEPSGDAFRLLLDKYRFDTNVAENISVAITVSDGRPPYVYQIDWGTDGEEWISSNDNETTFTHAYSKAGRNSGRVIVTDARGVSLESFFAVEVREAGDSNTWQFATGFSLLALLIVIAWRPGFIGSLPTRLILGLKFFKR